jgi:hypothetical protein
MFLFRYTSEYGAAPGIAEAEVETDIGKLKEMTRHGFSVDIER